jgi:hypothetical protein
VAAADRPLAEVLEREQIAERGAGAGADHDAFARRLPRERGRQHGVPPHNRFAVSRVATTGPVDRPMRISIGPPAPRGRCMSSAISSAHRTARSWSVSSDTGMPKQAPISAVASLRSCPRWRVTAR